MAAPGISNGHSCFRSVTMRVFIASMLRHRGRVHSRRGLTALVRQGWRTPVGVDMRRWRVTSTGMIRIPLALCTVLLISPVSAALLATSFDYNVTSTSDGVTRPATAQVTRRNDIGADKRPVV